MDGQRKAPGFVTSQWYAAAALTWDGPGARESALAWLQRFGRPAESAAFRGLRG